MSNRKSQRPKIKALPSRHKTLVSLVFLLLLSALGLPFGFVWGLREHNELTLLQKSSVPTQATVLGKRVDRSGDDDDYYISYAYQAPSPDGRLQFSREESIHRSTYESAEKGGSIQIIYAADDPSVARIGKVSFFDWFVVLLLPSIGLGMVWFIGSAVGRYLRARELDQWGKTTEGTIINSWVDRDSDGDTTYYVAYEFGHSIEVMQKVKRSLYEQLPIRSQVPVRYLPDDPTISRMGL